MITLLLLHLQLFTAIEAIAAPRAYHFYGQLEIGANHYTYNALKLGWYESCSKRYHEKYGVACADDVMDIRPTTIEIGCDDIPDRFQCHWRIVRLGKWWSGRPDDAPGYNEDAGAWLDHYQLRALRLAIEHNND